jgi:hypothetical protein
MATSIDLSPGLGGMVRGTGDTATPGGLDDFLAKVGHAGPAFVHLDHTTAMIGDSINTLPFIWHLHRLTGRSVGISGAFSRLVPPLVPLGVLAFDVPAPTVSLHFNLRPTDALRAAGPPGLHYSRGFFLCAGATRPPATVPLALVTRPCKLAPGVVIAPFTTSERGLPGNHARMWYPQRWRIVVDHLLRERGLGPIYVIGGLADDYAAFDFPGVIPLIGLALPETLDLMRRAPLVLTVETGLSHLAHFGGVSRHVLLYGDMFNARMVATTIGHMVFGKIADLQVGPVLDKIAAVLDGTGPA